DSKIMTTAVDSGTNHETSMPPNPTEQGAESEFHWLAQDDVKTALQEMISNNNYNIDQASQILSLSDNNTNDDDEIDTSSLSILRQVQEDATFQVFQKNNNDTDLVPGVYEGGLKVWECSLDLCKYLHDNKNAIDKQGGGHILELGCGHGLPACWVLKMAIKAAQRQQSGDDNDNDCNCYVTFSDYNEFVLNDVTLKNVLLNAQDACHSSVSLPCLSDWLSEHTAFGAGDWKKMSSLLLQNDGADRPPSATPKDGLFDVILAAETTYSETAATETAELLAKHLRPGKGVAYVATKRYYFGVGGGTSCLVDALNRYQQHQIQQRSLYFDVQVLEEYDNGVGNIRELLLIRSLAP
ncbi:MAG: hypothetical protein SGILL_003341, partial [Bacillariaceae sp.]